MIRSVDCGKCIHTKVCGLHKPSDEMNKLKKQKHGKCPIESIVGDQDWDYIFGCVEYEHLNIEFSCKHFESRSVFGLGE